MNAVHSETSVSSIMHLQLFSRTLSHTMPNVKRFLQIGILLLDCIFLSQVKLNRHHILPQTLWEPVLVATYE